MTARRLTRLQDLHHVAPGEEVQDQLEHARRPEAHEHRPVGERLDGLAGVEAPGHGVAARAGAIRRMTSSISPWNPPKLSAA